MKPDTNFVHLTHAASGEILRLSPIHVAAIVPHGAIYTGPRQTRAGVEGTHILTTPGVDYVVKESPEEVERLVSDVLGS